MNTQKPTHDPHQSNFAERIKLLIQRVGSATEIARMCGFSEGVVRSWRDGNTDPSRARCVTLSRTLGVSLIWLVAGEGMLQADPNAISSSDNQYSADTLTTQRTRHHTSHIATALGTQAAVDPLRLNTAMQILQSELDMAGSPMSLADNTDLLTNLYEILGAGGTSVDANAMLHFNRQLTARIHAAKPSKIA